MKLAQKEIIEPKFGAVPPKPLHPIFFVLFCVASLLFIVALLGLEYKFHMFIDFLVVFWTITLYFSEIITFTFLNIIVGLIFTLISIGFEAVWFVIYQKVNLSELVDQCLHR